MPGQAAHHSVGSDYLLKIDGIDGESIQQGHERWIEVVSWTWGAANSGSSSIGSGLGSGKAVLGDFQFEMYHGISSPKLYLFCCTGKHIPSATLHVRKAGGHQYVYVEWKFTDLVISSYKTGHKGKRLVICDEISFNFTQLEMTYRPQLSSGSLGSAMTRGFNVKTGTKL